MESDSDSDGSHISSTPPRHPFPSLPKPKPKPEPEPEPKRKQSPKPTSTLTKTTKSKPSKSPQKPSSLQAPRLNSTPTPCFSLPIKRSIPENPNLFESGSGSVRAGSFLISKSGSFSKFHSLGVRNENGSILTSGSSSKFDFGEVRDDGVGCGSSSGLGLGSVRAGSFSKFLSLGAKADKDSILITGSCSKFDFDEVCEDGIGVEVVKKRVVKKPSNLIGCGSGLGSGLVPVKRLKSSSEGNFVKLNINGHGRRFSFKGKKRGFSSSSRRSFRRWGKKTKGKNGVEGNGGNDDDVLGFECSGKPGNEDKMSKEDVELLRNVVLDVRNECSDENLVRLLKITHGYDSFREGQLEAIKMVLGGKSTMVVLPTGTGKSLCYQLPAIVFPGVTLVVSPLVALMIDQLKHLPSVVNGALLSSSQSLEEMSETLSLLREGSIKVLFVSPERFLNAEFMSIISSCSLISLVVIDEAHCVSEWSHNFRPSYMRLRASLLRDKLNVKCILALTATATTKTLGAIMHALDIPPTNLVQTIPLRNNLQLSVSSSGSNKMKDLITLIKSPPYSEVKSIIIYCKFQSETEMISKYLCDYSSVPAMSYHSGMLAKDRSRVQKLFCSNKIRVVVATVAFGMGLDKSDVGAVIHYSLPESLEEYVQEIGRAGRDGRLSYCHLYLDDGIYYKLRSYAYSDGVDEYAVNKLLSQVFGHEMKRKGEIYSLVRESASHRFDIKDEVILTILTQLELGETKYLFLLPQMNVTCSLNFHRTPPLELAAKDLVVAGILNSSESKHGVHVFDIPSVANAVGLTTVDLLNHLQSLKAKGEITYNLKDPAYCYVIVNAPRDLCSLAAQITKWLSEIECCKVMKLDMMFHAAVFAMTSCERVSGCDGAQHTSCLQKRISEYFSDEHHIDPPTKMHETSPFLRADIKVFLQSNSGAKFTPRAVARVLHGIASPAYPSATWSKTHFWGRYAHVDFKVIMDAAKAELISFVGKDVS